MICNSCCLATPQHLSDVYAQNRSRSRDGIFYFVGSCHKQNCNTHVCDRSSPRSICCQWYLAEDVGSVGMLVGVEHKSKMVLTYGTEFFERC